MTRWWRAFEDARARRRSDRLRLLLQMLWADELLEGQRGRAGRPLAIGRSLRQTGPPAGVHLNLSNEAISEVRTSQLLIPGGEPCRGTNAAVTQGDGRPHRTGVFRAK